MESPLRQCVNTLIVERISMLKVGSVVLEIGCGSRDLFKQMALTKGVVWKGLDPKGSVATHKGSVSKIPFPDDYFDAVVCSQSIEHWYEFYTPFDKGLSEIHRVLKPQGHLFLDFPIHLHGHSFFMLGKREKIMGLFDSRSWVIQETQDRFPAPPYYTWEGKRRKILAEWYFERILRKSRKPAYIVNIILKRKSRKYYPVRSFLRQAGSKYLYLLLRIGVFLYSKVRH